MKKVLLVEDDQFKMKALTDFIRSEFSQIELLVSKSVVSAVDQIDSGGVDLLLLDLAIPNYDDGSDASAGLGGVAVFRYLRQVEPDVPVVVITQFEALNEGSRIVDILTIRQNLRDEFGGQFLGLVQYRPSVSDWKEEVRKFLAGE